MKFGLMLGYSGAEMSLPAELVQHAETLGFDSVWTAEAYGSDATSPLAYLAAVTKRVRLGTSIMQLAADRCPTTSAQAQIGYCTRLPNLIGDGVSVRTEDAREPLLPFVAICAICGFLRLIKV